MNEIWKNIKDYEGLYQVSNLGRVKSIRKRTKNGFINREKILKPSDDNHGYLQVILYKDKTRKTFKVHRLVALAFIENINKYDEVNHINGVKSDNHVKNLEWCSHSMNMKHASENNLMSKESFRDIPVIAKKENKEIYFKNKKECSNYFGFNYWWYYNQVKYQGSPFIYNGYKIMEV